MVIVLRKVIVMFELLDSYKMTEPFGSLMRKIFTFRDLAPYTILNDSISNVK